MTTEQPKFDPMNSEYKKTSDLPEKERWEFEDVENGFIKKWVSEYHEIWEAEAKKANENRSVLKKLFSIDKQTAMDVAYDYAKKEDRDREKEKQDKKEELKNSQAFLEKEMLKVFADIIPKLLPYIKAGCFESIVSEEESGRLPAETIKRILEKIYQKIGNNKNIEIFPLPSKRGLSGNATYKGKTWAEYAKEAESWFMEEKMGKGVLYITEYVSHGTCFTKSYNCLADATGKAESAGKQIPDIYCFVTMGGQTLDDLHDYWQNHFRHDSLNSSTSQIFLRGEGTDSSNWYHLNRTNNELAEKVSDKIVEQFIQ
jgi:hypothetical protein